MSNPVIPPPRCGTFKSPHRPKIEKLKAGQFIPCSSVAEQAAIYACGRRMGKNVAKRTVDGEPRVYLKPITKKRGAK